MRKKLICSIIVIIIVCINTFVYADVGSFESYDSGSDWSSSSWYSDSSWSSSDGDIHSSWSSGDLDSDYDDYYSLSNRGMPMRIPIKNIAIIFAVLVIIAIIIYKSNKNIEEEVDKVTEILDEFGKREPEIYQGFVEEKLKRVDELFNQEEFNQKAKMLFVKMQNAWTDRNWEEIRPFETDELFEQHKMQIEGYIRSNTINVMDRICVLYSKLLSFEQTGDKDILNVVIKSRMSDYIIDATTKEIVKGDKQTERIKFYKLEFIRKTGVKTKPEQTGISDTNCPNCGAPTKITSSGECEYCKSIITNGEFGWVLNNLEPYKY